jgi:hypothetical protein
LSASETAGTLPCRDQRGPARTTEAADRFTEWSAVMDYDKMKALMEASREKSSSQRKPQVTEFPKPDSRPDWKYLDYVAKERMAA